jgi:hypothetical protein
MAQHYLPPGVKPEHIDAVIQNIVDFLPHLQRAKAIELPGVHEIEQQVERVYNQLQLMKQHYVPHTNKLDV